jgi:nucleotide-binding universal stress UspA family protein
MKTILAAIDFSAVSQRVVAEALELADAVNGRVVLLHSVPPSPIIATDLVPLVGTALYLTDDVAKAADRHLRRIRRDQKDRGKLIETICLSGFPVQHIISTAKKLRANYIVIGSHGHTALHDLVVGSTASGVLKRASCPVVVVPVLKKRRKPRRR